MDFGTKFGIASAIAAMGVAVFALFAPYEWHNSPVLLRRVFLIFGAILFFTGVFAFFVLPTKEYPVVKLRFVNKTNAEFQIINLSNVGAQNIKWSLAMFDASLLIPGFEG